MHLEKCIRFEAQNPFPILPPDAQETCKLRNDAAAVDEHLVAQIPHLSTFKLLSRSECIEPLRSILDLR